VSGTLYTLDGYLSMVSEVNDPNHLTIQAPLYILAMLDGDS